MSGPKPIRPPDVTGGRVQRLIEQLARRIQAHRLASAGATGRLTERSGDGVGGLSVTPEAPISVRIRESGQRELLRQLVIDGGGRAASPRRSNLNTLPAGRARGRR